MGGSSRNSGSSLSRRNTLSKLHFRVRQSFSFGKKVGGVVKVIEVVVEVVVEVLRSSIGRRNTLSKLHFQGATIIFGIGL